MFRRQLMESVSVFVVGKSHFCRSGSYSLDKATVQWKVCHAGIERLHTTQPFLYDCHFLAVFTQSDRCPTYDLGV